MPSKPAQQKCPECLKSSKIGHLKWAYLNLEEKVLICDNTLCPYPWNIANLSDLMASDSSSVMPGLSLSNGSKAEAERLNASDKFCINTTIPSDLDFGMFELDFNGSSESESLINVTKDDTHDIAIEYSPGELYEPTIDNVFGQQYRSEAICDKLGNLALNMAISDSRNNVEPNGSLLDLSGCDHNEIISDVVTQSVCREKREQSSATLNRNKCMQDVDTAAKPIKVAKALKNNKADQPTDIDMSEDKENHTEITQQSISFSCNSIVSPVETVDNVPSELVQSVDVSKEAKDDHIPLSGKGGVNVSKASPSHMNQKKTTRKAKALKQAEQLSKRDLFRMFCDSPGKGFNLTGRMVIHKKRKKFK